ncbi:MAG TPA: GNAT family N-acetyltransferase [Candidatus Babeliales bacterium]|nr:GNAT family N-acetyltransferase [Candidatus Babeliales bacterium]
MTTNKELIALALTNLEEAADLLLLVQLLAPVAVTPCLITARTYLRPFALTDLPLLQALHQDPQVMRYFHSGPRSTTDSTRHLHELIAHQAQYQFSSWAVFSQATDEFIGRAGPLVWPETGALEIGYVLHQKFWGQGLGTELARALVQWVFQHLAIEQIIAVTMPENLASRRVLEKAGLQLQQQLEINGYPAVQYVITRVEWMRPSINLTSFGTPRLCRARQGA